MAIVDAAMASRCFVRRRYVNNVDNELEGDRILLTVL